jgi:hypothetical protein
LPCWLLCCICCLMWKIVRILFVDRLLDIILFFSRINFFQTHRVDAVWALQSNLITKRLEKLIFQMKKYINGVFSYEETTQTNHYHKKKNNLLFVFLLYTLQRTQLKNRTPVQRNKHNSFKTYQAIQHNKTIQTSRFSAQGDLCASTREYVSDNTIMLKEIDLL